MTSDEQRKAFEQWATSQQFCLERFDAVDEYMNDNTHFAWEGWQAAQKVKPLEFKQDEDGDYCAKTILGEYRIYAGKMFIFRRLELKTLEEAIEAANADFRKRVLS